MLTQRSLPLLAQQMGSKTNLFTRAINTLPRQQCQQQQHKLQSRQSWQQLLSPQKLQQQQQQQQQKRFLSAITSSQSPPLTWSAIKTNFHKNILKGSVCLVLLPLSTVSCTASLNLGTSTTALQSNRQSSTGKSNSFEEDPNDMASEDYKNAKSIYDFTVKDTHGNDVSLDKYKGHVVLVVNIASQCGLTKNNYKKLTDLKEKYHDKGLRILNFPCNQFGSQMPEQDGEPMVCHLRDAKADIGDLFQKIDVNGSNAAPLYQYLKAKQTGTLGSGIKWNFTKFLVNQEGIPVNRYAPTTDPMDIAKDIEKLLAAAN